MARAVRSSNDDYSDIIQYLIRDLDNRKYLFNGYCFLFLVETTCCDPSSEPSLRDGSDEGSQHMFYAEFTKIGHYYHQILRLI